VYACAHDIQTKMAVKLESCANIGISVIRFLHAKGNTPKQIHQELLAMCGEHVMSNVTPHMAQHTQQWFQQYGWEVHHPTYSPDLAPSDFHLFGSLRRHLSGQKFVDDDIAAVMTWLQAFDQMSLQRASVHWFPTGSCASTGVVIM
jgi:hypothetical protein